MTPKPVYCIMPLQLCAPTGTVGRLWFRDDCDLPLKCFKTSTGSEKQSDEREQRAETTA